MWKNGLLKLLFTTVIYVLAFLGGSSVCGTFLKGKSGIRDQHKPCRGYPDRQPKNLE